MARQIEGVYEAVLRCAEEEFLAKGYKDASLLATIAEARRHEHRIDLHALRRQGGAVFCAGGTGGGCAQGDVLDIQERFHNFGRQRAGNRKWAATRRRSRWRCSDYIYDHFDIFQILLEGAEGTRFAHFVDELVEIEVDYTYKYMAVIGCESVKRGIVTRRIHPYYRNSVFQRHV